MLVSSGAQKWGCQPSWPAQSRGALPASLDLPPSPILLSETLSQHTPAPGDVGGAGLLAPSAPEAEEMLCSPAWVLQVLGMASELLALNLCSFLFF